MGFEPYLETLFQSYFPNCK